MRLSLAGTRIAACGAIGAVACIGLAPFVPWQLAALVGWNAAAGVMVAWVLGATLPLDSPATEEVAMREDNSRVLADVLLLAASVASLVGVGFALVKSNGEKGIAGVALTLMAVLTVVVSWAAVHTVYLLRYARLWFTDGGGVDFNGGERPDYRDFAYLAFTVGMTYQVSDTDLTSKVIRRTATHHALLSYLFGTVVVAMTINVVASLVK